MKTVLYPRCQVWALFLSATLSDRGVDRNGSALLAQTLKMFL